MCVCLCTLVVVVLCWWVHLFGAASKRAAAAARRIEYWRFHLHWSSFSHFFRFHFPFKLLRTEHISTTIHKWFIFSVSVRLRLRLRLSLSLSSSINYQPSISLLRLSVCCCVLQLIASRHLYSLIAEDLPPHLIRDASPSSRLDGKSSRGNSSITRYHSLCILEHIRRRHLCVTLRLEVCSSSSSSISSPFSTTTTTTATIIIGGDNITVLTRFTLNCVQLSSDEDDRWLKGDGQRECSFSLSSSSFLLDFTFTFYASSQEAA